MNEQTELNIPKPLYEIMREGAKNAASLARTASEMRKMKPAICKAKTGNLFSIKFPRQIIASGITEQAAVHGVTAMVYVLESCAKDFEKMAKEIYLESIQREEN